MKKIIYLLYFLLSIFMFYMKIGLNNISFILSLGLGILLYSIFSNISIKEELEKKKTIKGKNKYIIFSSLLLLILFIIYGGISFILGSFINIDKLSIINVVVALMVYSLIIFKIFKEYLEVFKYKKLLSITNNYFHIITILLEVVSIILFKLVFKIDNYINILVLYSIPIFNIFIIIVLLYLLILRKKKDNNKEKIDIRSIKDSIFKNKEDTFYNIIKSSYIYVSIIILYYVLNNKYYYDNKDISMYITSIYFYGLIFIYYISLIIKKVFKDKYIVLEDKIINKDNNIDSYFHSLINSTIKYSMGVMILLMVISGPITNILYKGEYNFIFELSILLFFYILYEIIMKINILCNKRRYKMVLLIGLFTLVIFEIPLINSIYRMGYTLSFGSIISIVLGFIISIILGFIFIYKKLKINMLKNFNNILNIIYQNIILCVILVLFTFILDVKSTSIIYSIINIIVYSLITIIYYIIINIINRK